MTDFAKYRGALTRELAVELRHDLRTPVNHIVGYTEMLLEDAPESDSALRDSLQAILAGAREALALINRSVGAADNTVTAEMVEGLFESLRGQQTRIGGAVERLLADRGANGEDAVTHDLRRIQQAAQRLAPAAVGAATAFPVAANGP